MPKTNSSHAQLDAKLAAIRAAGYPVTLEELDRWIPAPPDAQNQALLLTNAFAALVPVDHVPDLPARTARLPVLTQRWFRLAVATNQVALQRLHDAAKLDRCRYPVDWRSGWSPLLPHPAKAREAAEMLRLAAALHVEDGRVDEAVAAILTIGSVARSLEWDPTRISQWSRTAVLACAHQAAERLLNQTRPTEAHLRSLADLFHAAQTVEPFTRALVAERSLALDLLEQPWEKLAEVELWYWPETNDLPVRANAFVMNKEADGLFLLHTMESLIAESQAAELWQSLEAVEALGVGIQGAIGEPLERRLVVSTMALATGPPDNLRPSPPEDFVMLARNIAFMQTAEVAMAVERYRRANGGRVPPDLSALAPAYLRTVPLDPFDGKALRFKALPRGYVVYSIGRDREDNGGRAAEPPGRGGEQDRDITFTVEWRAEADGER